MSIQIIWKSSVIQTKSHNNALASGLALARLGQQKPMLLSERFEQQHFKAQEFNQPYTGLLQFQTMKTFSKQH